MRARNTYMDIAKGIGMLAVIVAHIGIGKAGNILLYSFHLPLFFIISGYFFKMEDDIKNFLLKKSKGYLVPYFACAIVIACFLPIQYHTEMWYAPFFYAGFVLQMRYTTLWFLATLYVAVLLFWCICKRCKNHTGKIMVVSATLSIIFICYDEFVGQALPWNIDTAFIVLIYLALGYSMKQNDRMEQLVHVKWKWLLIIAGVVVSGACTIANYKLCQESYEMFRCQYGIFPLTITAAITGSLSIILFSSYLQKEKILAWIGQNTMSFFAFHQSVAMVIMGMICNRSKLLIEHSVLYKSVMFFGTLAICYIIHIVLIKCRLGFVVGKKKNV